MDSTILSLDIETYGACHHDADGYPLPVQTVFHPVRSQYQDFRQSTPPVRKDGSDRRILTAAVTLVKSPHPTWASMHEWQYGETMVFQLHEASHRRLLRQWLSHATILVGMNITFDLLFLRACGYRDLLSPARLSLVDLSVVNYLHCELRPERSLKDMGVALGTHAYGEESSLKSGFRYPDPRAPQLHSYNAQDTINTVVAVAELARRIRADHGSSSAKLSDFSLRHYSDVLWLCLRMAEAGIALNPAQLSSLEAHLLAHCESLEEQASAQHGLILRGTGSDKAKRTLLLGAVEEVDALNPGAPSIIDDKRFQRTKAANDLSCTDQNRKLLSLYLSPDSPIKAAFDIWDSHAHAQKIISSYTFPLLRHARTNEDRRDSILLPVGGCHLAFPSWFACPSQVKDSSGQEGGTEQGRLTCKSPALQTWPEEILGNQFANPPVPSCLQSRYGDDGIVVSYDASQVELRVAGLLSGEPRMLEVYQQDRSLHMEMAIHLFGADHIASLPNPKKSIEYDCGKTANFSSLFRSSAATMRAAALKQSNLDRPLSFFEKIVAGRATAYPVLWAWQEAQIALACRQRRLELPFTGQSRWFWGTPAVIRSAYEQTIVNFPVQTTAANVTIRLQIDLLSRLSAHPDIVQVANVYDAIVFDLPRSKWPVLQAAFSDAVEHTVTSGYWSMLLSHYGHPMPLKYEHSFICGAPPMPHNGHVTMDPVRHVYDITTARAQGEITDGEALFAIREYADWVLGGRVGELPSSCTRQRRGVPRRSGLVPAKSKEGEAMTNAELERMAELEAKATEGPWSYSVWAEHMPRAGHASSLFQGNDDDCGDCLADFSSEATVDDAAFIVASRTFVPAAIAEIKRLREELKTCRELLTVMRGEA